MKKYFTIIVIVMFCHHMFAQTYFEGRMIANVKTKYESNVEFIINTAKKNIDENKDIDAASKGMAKMMIKPIVKNMLKKMDKEKYVTSFPDGEYIQYTEVQGEKNRLLSYVPDLGRVFIQDCEKGDFIIAYPKLKIAYKYAIPTSKEVKTNYTKTSNTKEEEVFMIDGFRCTNNYTLFEYEKVGGEMEDTVTVNGTLYVKMPALGYRLADYNILKLYEVSNEYYSQTIDVKKMESHSINDQNFVIPSDFKMIPSVDKLVKIIQKAIKNGELSIPFDGTMPDIIWDVAN